LLDPCGESPLVASYLRDLAGSGTAPVSLLHPADEMYSYNLHSLRGSAEAAALLYFLKGRQIARTFGEIARWRFGGPEGIASALDFAAGYGRSTRFLARELSPGSLWAAEIDPEAVRFQEEVLGVRGLRSGRQPDRFDPGRSFDLILAASFFSHLPVGRFGSWLARLFSFLAPGGVLLLSVHGPGLLSDPGADWSEGIVFRAESETRRLEPSEYGTSWVTEGFVREAAGRVFGREAPVLFFPRGLCAHQDLYAITRPPVPPLPPPDLSLFPRGELDSFKIGGQVVRLSGWAEAGPGERAPHVRLLVGPTVVRRSPGQRPPGAKLHWSFEVPREQTPPDEVVRVEAESERGLSNILAMGTLRPHLPAA
jgi:SAM-dependent methyltransferase